ncbi:hypothetical protein E4U53_001569 [Claviceps sorghi]|nr:hypothetical protein E4U53_001569 [Claviceps sorghi]
MPLIIVSGLPTSGKSTRAKQLYDYLAGRIAESEPAKYKLHLISDDSLSISRTVYDLSPDTVRLHTRSANSSEKDARAALYGAVKRVLSDKDFVILDGLNYIKGWRYQLHCEAKALRTPNCILRVACSVDQARQVNEERLRRAESNTTDRGSNNAVENMPQTAAETAAEAAADDDNKAEAPSRSAGPEAESGAEPYSQSNWDNLVFRYEEPNPMTRWDSPLFAILWDDSEAQTKRTFDDLWDAMAGEGRKIVKPNQSTIQRGRDASGDYLYVLERETQDIVKRILEQQGEDGGGEVTIPLNASGRGDLVVDLPAGKKLALPQLQRLRRAFVALNRGGIGLESVGNMASDGMREVFVSYLNDAFEKDE